MMLSVVVVLATVVGYTVMGVPGATDHGGTAMTSHVEFTEHELDPGPDGADGPQVAGEDGVAVELRYVAGKGYSFEEVEVTDGDGNDLMKYVGTGAGGPPYEAISESSGRFSPGYTVRVSCVDGNGASCDALQPGDDVIVTYGGDLVASHEVQG